jgi:hypothetical protein
MSDKISFVSSSPFSQYFLCKFSVYLGCITPSANSLAHSLLLVVTTGTNIFV